MADDEKRQKTVEVGVEDLRAERPSAPPPTKRAAHTHTLVGAASSPSR